MKNIKELVGLILIMILFSSLLLLSYFYEQGWSIYFQVALILTTVINVVGIVLLIRVK